MTGRLLIWLCCILCCAGTAFSQPATGPGLLSNLRTRLISTQSDHLSLDTLSIVPNTVTIAELDSSYYSIDYINAILYWKKTPPIAVVRIQYRVFAQKLSEPANYIAYDSVMNYSIGRPYVSPYQQSLNETFFDFGNIQYSGTFGRGLSFGNSQDAVVSSNLNLQLSGYLTDSIRIVAAITDNNIPIQPDGTTQQLNEFDRIFLQFSKKHWALSMGDIDIRKQASDYLQFYKRLQGMAFEIQHPVGEKLTNQLSVSGSIAKGKFTRNVFDGLEGNQGPYRLQGANNELFFIVLANTERVYIDGELLQRGEDQDYIINYNTAEITFMPKRMITKDRRIQVEFEYADRNYLNSNLYIADELTMSDKFSLRIGAFSNQDAKNSPINQTLDPSQKEFLQTIGKDPMQAFYPQEIIDTFSMGKILYKKIDTTYNGITDSIYVYSTHPDSARYTLSFIDVGIGNGNYVPALDGTNGKVYRWVQPVDGQPQGQFEPAVFLVTPKQQQLISVGGDYQATRTTLITTEWAMSNYDANTFSKEKGEQGMARKVLLTQEIPLKQKSWTFTTMLGWEKIDSAFRPLERLRTVEYTRDWGLPLTTSVQAKEEILQAGVKVQQTQNMELEYRWMQYERNNGFKGIRHHLLHQYNFKGWLLQQSHMISLVEDGDNEGYFWKPRIELAKRFEKLGQQRVAALYFKEFNNVKHTPADSVVPYSFGIEHFQISTTSNDARPNFWGITYFMRINHLPFAGEMLKTDRSHNVDVFANILGNQYRQMRLTAGYRSLKVWESVIQQQEDDQTILGRVEYQFNEVKGLISGNALFEAGAGQEQKRDFAFMEVPAGQGEYTWIDYNEDGIQQLNEFEVALFQDQARYIRIFTPTNEYVKANYNTFNYSLALNPRNLLGPRPEGSWAKLLSVLNFQSSLQLTKKETAQGLVQLNPFKAPLQDSSLLTMNTILINTFSINRFHQKWGIDITNAQTDNKSLLSYGYETRSLTDWTLKLRWNVRKMINFEWIGKQGTNTLQNDNMYFSNRNYEIRQFSLEPKVIYTVNLNWRISGGYKYTEKENLIEAAEMATIHAVNAETKVNWLQNTSVQARFTYSTINFESKGTITNPTSTYIILDGLSAGKNYLWTIDLNKRLSKNLELSIQYEGRKPGENRMVHVGRAAIRAIL